MGEDAGVHFVVQYTLRDTPAFYEGMLGGEGWDHWPTLGRVATGFFLCLIRCSALKGEKQIPTCVLSQRGLGREATGWAQVTP